VISALFKAFSQFGDPRIRRVVWLSAGLALAVLVGLAVAIWIAVDQFSGIETGWLATVVDFATGFGVVILAWLLFPAAIGLTVGLFLEDVADAVEARHYPGLPAVRAQSVREAIGAGLKFAAVALALNLIALPFYLLLIWVPFLSPILFYSLNGYLLGREYFEAVALRRLDDRQARLLRRARGGQVFLAGVIIAFLLTVPFVNLVAPVIATGFMLHLFEGMRRQMARPPDEGVGGRGRGLSQK
jgi:uncharacterized protein involved in cysteine biosynthesis